jgi:hypothetical protein
MGLKLPENQPQRYISNDLAPACHAMVATLVVLELGACFETKVPAFPNAMQRCRMAYRVLSELGQRHVSGMHRRAEAGDRSSDVRLLLRDEG